MNDDTKDERIYQTIIRGPGAHEIENAALDEALEFFGHGTVLEIAGYSANPVSREDRSQGFIARVDVRARERLAPSAEIRAYGDDNEAIQAYAHKQAFEIFGTGVELSYPTDYTIKRTVNVSEGKYMALITVTATPAGPEIW
jgi:hypothetical protein